MKAILINAIIFQAGWLCCVLAGAIAGPAAYFAGHKLGGVQTVDFTTAMLVLGLGWSLLMPTLMLLSNRLDGTSHRSVKSAVMRSCDAHV